MIEFKLGNRRLSAVVPEIEDQGYYVCHYETFHAKTTDLYFSWLSDEEYQTVHKMMESGEISDYIEPLVDGFLYEYYVRIFIKKLGANEKPSDKHEKIKATLIRVEDYSKIDIRRVESLRGNNFFQTDNKWDADYVIDTIVHYYKPITTNED